MSLIDALQSLEDRVWDVAIIGAGPAGAMAALQLARYGRSVLLIDRERFPRHKVCGGCLNERAVAALDAAGLPTLLDDLGAVPLRSFYVAAKGRALRMALPGGAVVSRHALDNALVEAAKDAGATVVEGWSARPEAGGVSGWTIVLRRGEEKRRIHASLCLMAAGLAVAAPGDAGSRSAVTISPSSRIGAGALFRSSTAICRDGTITMVVAKNGYVGLAQVEDGRTVVATALDAGYVRTQGSLVRAVVNILASAGCPVPYEIHNTGWKGTPPLTRRVRPLAGHRFLVLGDAAGYAEPFTGEGMAWAMTSGLSAAALANAHLHDWTLNVEQAWTAWHWRNVGRHQLRCRLVARGLRSPLLVDASLVALQLFPALIRPLIRTLNAPLEAREIGRWV